METLETLKNQLAESAKAMELKKLELAQAMKALREESKKLKDQEAEAKAQAKKLEAEKRAEAMKKALELGAIGKVNMTEEIRTRLLKGQDIDTIQTETGWNRKSILDRVWSIEKKLGIR